MKKLIMRLIAFLKGIRCKCKSCCGCESDCMGSNSDVTDEEVKDV